MKDKIKKIILDIKSVIFVLTFMHLGMVVLCCWTDIGEIKNVSDFKEKNRNARRGYAEYVDITYKYKGGGHDYYNLYDENGMLLSANREGSKPSRWTAENYLGCIYVCYYDTTCSPLHFFICYDSLIFNTPPIYKTVAYVKHVVLSETTDYTEITFKWKTASGKWKHNDQCISRESADKYIQYKRSRRPVECLVYQTMGGQLAHIF